jgi:hypothetical protein
MTGWCGELTRRLCVAALEWALWRVRAAGSWGGSRASLCILHERRRWADSYGGTDGGGVSARASVVSAAFQIR